MVFPFMDTINQSLKAGKNLIPVCHESCINHELREYVNIEKFGDGSNDPAFEIHIKCLKGHNLYKTNPKCCDDYDLTIEPFGWKLAIMEEIMKDLME